MQKEGVQLPPANRLVRVSDFDKQFTSLALVTGWPYEKVFNALNDAYRAEFKEDRYSDYNSYRVARSRRINRR